MIELDELEKVGITLIAIARTEGLEAFDCSTCTLQDKRNCECDGAKTDGVFYHELLGELTACPLRYISQAVVDFFDQYDYYEKYPSSAPSYYEQNPRFWQAVKHYESIKTKLTIKEKSSNKETDNLSKMHSLFKK
jgi:hypothetical protein